MWRRVIKKSGTLKKTLTSLALRLDTRILIIVARNEHCRLARWVAFEMNGTLWEHRRGPSIQIVHHEFRAILFQEARLQRRIN